MDETLKKDFLQFQTNKNEEKEQFKQTKENILKIINAKKKFNFNYAT